jgi:hypothetical protein
MKVAQHYFAGLAFKKNIGPVRGLSDFVDGE